jgi:Zn-dependent protease with chaperone function
VSFDPSLPNDEINVTKTHPLKEAVTLVVGVVIVTVVLAIGIGWAVDFVAPRISPALEMKLFAGWLEDETEDEPDSRAIAVAKLLKRLAGHWGDGDYTFQVKVWDEAEPNAMAFPGGLIAVTSGLLDTVTSENELAFVLGHELGHFHNRDHLRGIGRGVALSLSLFALGIGGGGAVTQVAGVAGEFATRGFGRAQETAADEFGLQLVAAEYGHTAGAADLFEHLRAIRDDSLLAGYLSTHPLHSERIDEILATARAAGWPLVGKRSELAAEIREKLEVDPGAEPTAEAETTGESSGDEG